jgi:multidrug resistance efflux pump
MRIVLSIILFASASLHAQDRPVLLSGEVIAPDSQSIVMPPSDSSPTSIRYFVAEGQVVKAGDVVLRIDSGDPSAVRNLELQMSGSRAKADKEIAELIVSEVDAHSAVLNAKAALDKALVDAALPRKFLSTLDFDRYQGEAARAKADLQQKQRASTAAQEAVQRRQRDAELEISKLQIGLAFAKVQQTRGDVVATTSGVVTHGFSTFRSGKRYDEGESAMSGTTVGQVISGAKLAVRAYALEADRPFVQVNMPVTITLDAVPGREFVARIERISTTPEVRGIWGAGRYFSVDVALPESARAVAVPGMSALLEKKGDNVVDVEKRDAEKDLAVLELEGELLSAKRSAISPPSIPGQWNVTLLNLLPEGSKASPNTTVAVFDGSATSRSLAEKSAELEQVKKSQEKLALDHAEAKKISALSVEEARTNAEKAARKASGPAQLVRRVDYDKLVIDRHLFEQLAALAMRKQQAQSDARDAERAALESQAAQLQADIGQLQKAISQLAVKPTISGLVLHGTMFNGEKFTAGSQVYIGLNVASVDDPASLYVSASVVEGDSWRVKVGQAALVFVGSGGRTYKATVRSLSPTFASKSRAQPIIVRKLELAFAEPFDGLKPGTSVRVELQLTKPLNSNTVMP